MVSQAIAKLEWSASSIHRKFSAEVASRFSKLIPHSPRSNATVEQFAQAAATAPSVSAPRTASGGVVGAAATEASASATQSTASPSSTGNAGVESRGSVQWVMFGFTGVVAALFGSLIV